MRYMVACGDLEKVENAITKINDAFNKSSRIRTWYRPTNTTWVVQCHDNTTKATDLRDMVRMVSDSLRTMVTPFIQSDYAGFLESETVTKFNDWLKNNPEPKAAPEPPKPSPEIKTAEPGKTNSAGSKETNSAGSADTKLPPVVKTDAAAKPPFNL